MGTIHEFPLWRAQRPAEGKTLQGEIGLDAQVVIFPGVRIERESAGKPAARTARQVTASPDGGRLTR